MLAGKITTHVQDALGRLLYQYQGQPNITALLTCLVGGVQTLEDVIYDLDAKRQIYSGLAVGAQLDMLGTIIGLKRNGLSDAQYYRLLLGTIAENNSDGTQATLLNIIQVIYSSVGVYLKSPNSPGGEKISNSAWIAVGIAGPGTSSDLYPLLNAIITASLASGVSLAYVSTFSPTKAFAMAGPQPWVAGFGSLTDPTVGGGFAALISTNII